MAEVFQPTRSEPFFELIPGFDVSRLKLTVRWADYLDGIGNSVNTTSLAIGEASVVAETIGAQVSAIVKNTQNTITDLTNIVQALASQNESLSSIVVNSQKNIDDLNQMIAESLAQNASLRSEFVKLRSKLNNLESEHHGN